jgi:hypothetical protein
MTFIIGSVAVDIGVGCSCILVGVVVGVEDRVGVGGITIGFSLSERTWLQAVRPIIKMLAIQDKCRLRLDGHSRRNNSDCQTDIISNVILQFLFFLLLALVPQVFYTVSTNLGRCIQKGQDDTDSIQNIENGN